MLTYDSKHPTEAEHYTMDFSRRMAVGETVSTKSCTVSCVRGADPDAAAMVSGAASESGGVVTQKIIAGLPGRTYRLAWTITTSAGQTLQEFAELSVISP